MPPPIDRDTVLVDIAAVTADPAAHAAMRSLLGWYHSRPEMKARLSFTVFLGAMIDCIATIRESSPETADQLAHLAGDLLADGIQHYTLGQTLECVGRAAQRLRGPDVQASRFPYQGG